MSDSPRRTAVGIDIGGTFTDVVMIHRDHHEVRTAKVLTTPDDPTRGVLAAVTELLQGAGSQPEEVVQTVHATTLATNLILERKGAKVAYLTTANFGDILIIGNERKGDAQKYDLFYTKQEPIVPRRRIVDIVERTAADGSVVTPLDTAQARAAIAAVLESERPDAVAVCFLHSYANGRHEQLAAELVRELAPDIYTAVSSEVWPEYRELPRACTTVMSAYVGPTVTRYIQRLADELARLGVTARLQIMGSNGGITSSATVTRRPVQLVESGPAAGVMAAAHIGRTCGIGDLISFDMGGTTAKAGLVRNGAPEMAHEFYVGGPASAGLKQINTGYPIQIPVIDLAEVGAGGGSIARLDEGGALRVGPDSAGSEPGPACYGRGGTAATVTDANLLLGYVNPDYFLGGRMPIHAERAEQAVAELADAASLDVLDAAAGVHEVVNTTMAAAIRIVTLERGIDPRDFTLVASGGAAGAHVAALAEEFGIARVIVPANPGVGSAVGLLACDVVTDHVRTQVVAHGDAPAGSAAAAAIAAVYQELEAQAAAEIQAEGFGAGNIGLQRHIDVRYRHQAHELTVPLQGCDLDGAATAFGDLYEQLYGLRQADPVEFVNYRVRVTGPVPKPDWSTSVRADAPAVVHAERPVFFGRPGGGPESSAALVPTPVYRRDALLAGHVVPGPAVVEEPATTVVVPPGWIAEVDAWLSLVLRPSR